MQARIRTTNNFRLLDLSTELIHMIVTELRSRDDLCAIALTCRQLQHIAAELLRYHSVSIKISHDCQPRQLRSQRLARQLQCLRIDNDQRQCQVRGEDELKSLVHGIEEKPRLAAMVRRLSLSTHNMELDDMSDAGHSILLSCLESLPNLEELSIVSTYTLTRPAQMPRKCSLLFRKASLLEQPEARFLRCLHTCKLNFRHYGCDRWPLHVKHLVFLHPTLRRLHISWARHSGTDLDDLRQFRSATALEELHLEQCDIRYYALYALLSLPRALSSITIRNSSMHFPIRSMEGYIPSLSPHFDSLQELTILQHWITELLHDPQDLRCCRNLKHLDILPQALLGTELRGIGEAQTVWPRKNSLSDLLPLSLESLVLSYVVLDHRKLLDELLCDFVGRKEKHASALKAITIAFIKKQGDYLERDLMATPEVRDIMQEAGVQIVYSVMGDNPYATEPTLRMWEDDERRLLIERELKNRRRLIMARAEQVHGEQ